MPSFEEFLSTFCKHNPKATPFCLSLVMHKALQDNHVLACRLLLLCQFEEVAE